MGKKQDIQAAMRKKGERKAGENPLAAPPKSRKGFRRHTIVLHNPQSDFVDDVVARLRAGKVPRANRSMVLQQLVILGEEALREKSEEDLCELFRERLAKRLAGDAQ